MRYVLDTPPEQFTISYKPAGIIHHRRQTLETQPRSSEDTCINSIYSMYGGGSGSSHMSWPTQQQTDRGRQSGEVGGSCSQTVTLFSNLPSDGSSNRCRPSSFEQSELAYHSDHLLPSDNTHSQSSHSQLLISVAMVGVENSPRVSLATTSSTHEQSSYATPPSTRSYSELFEDSGGGGPIGSNFRTSDISSSSHTTAPAITLSPEFRSGSPLSKCPSKGSSICQQLSSIDLPPLPSSQQTTPSSRHSPIPSSLFVPQRSLKRDTEKPLPAPQPSLRSPQSKISLVPSEGEDIDAFHVRNTYAQLEAVGVKGDGYEEGIERTRARMATSRQSQSQADAALGDGTAKTKDLDVQEIQALRNVDRYGFFFSTTSHDRLILLNSGPFQKKLSVVPPGPPNVSPNAIVIRALPQVLANPKEASRISKWNRMLVPQKRQQSANTDGWRIRPSKESKFRERTYKGIPDRWRRAAWDLMMTRMAGLGVGGYDRLAEEYRDGMEKPSTYDVQIDLDVPRTISGHIMFRTRYGAGQRSLFHVLHSFSLRCSTCGYVQGMGPIAATLLCYFEPERVYASLVLLHDAFHLHTVFNPGFPGMLEAIYVQERIMESMMPAVYAAFKRHMISTTSYATKWYITLFANSVPFQTQLRLWDAFLLEGYDVFVAVAVAVLWAYRDHITSNSANFETILSLLSSFFVPEDDDAFMSWISTMLGDKKIRVNMVRWRRDWKALVASGKEGNALL